MGAEMVGGCDSRGLLMLVLSRLDLCRALDLRRLCTIQKSRPKRMKVAKAPPAAAPAIVPEEVGLLDDGRLAVVSVAAAAVEETAVVEVVAELEESDVTL